MCSDPRMSAARNGSISQAFSAAFGGGSAPQGGPAPFAFDNPGTQEQAPAAAPQPSVTELSAGAARVLRMASTDPHALAAEVEAMALASLKAESRAAKAEAELAAMRNTPAAQLAALRRGEL